VSVSSLLLADFVLGLPLGLLLGAALGPIAARDGGWGGYGSFRRRATRLAHVAAVMLPALAGLYAVALPAAALATPAAHAAAWLWSAGLLALPAALLVAAPRPRLAPWLVPAPAACLIAASAAFAFSLFSSGVMS
jgi:hypothetical protein